MVRACQRTAVLGAGGFLGSTFRRRSGAWTSEVFSTASRPGDCTTVLDVRDADAVARFLDECNPDLVILCAAMTDVDACERDPSASELINYRVPVHLASQCHRRGIRLVAFSTDYVFDGVRGPYAEDAATRPVNVYGMHKARAEESLLAACPSALVVRTSQLYDAPVTLGGFAALVTAAAAAREPIVLSREHFNTPSHVDDVVAGTWRLLGSGATGIFHVAGPRTMSRIEAAREVLTAQGLGTDSCIPGLRPAAANRPPRCGLRIDKAQSRIGSYATSIHDHFRMASAAV